SFFERTECRYRGSLHRHRPSRSARLGAMETLDLQRQPAVAARRATSLKLKDRRFGEEWFERVQDRWNYDDLVADPRWREDWISFDGVVHHAGSNRLLLGITSFAADIFKSYDLGAGRFADLGFARVANRYDAKFHRSMELTRDGRSLYAATALLH